MTTPYFTGFKLVLLTFALGLGTFIQILDTSIANVAIAYIAGDLAVSPDQGTWVITSFAISNGLILALTGWLTSRFGGVKLFIWSTSLFSITSWLCGIATSLPLLVFFRVLQGASAGALIPLSQALLLTHYPEEKKGLALGFWTMIVVVAPVMGPIVGGYLTDNYGWRWIFYINIPLGFLSAWMTWLLLRGEKVKIKKRPLDTIGLILLILAVSCWQVFLDKGQDLDWLSSYFIRTMLIITIISMTLFIAWNYYSSDPIINFDYFKHRNFVMGTIIAAIAFLMFFGSNVLLPLWLETEMGYNAWWAGIAVMPVGIASIFLSPIVGRFLSFVDARLVTTISLICFAWTFFWFSNLTPQASIFSIMEPRFYQGFALILFFIPIVSMTLDPIPKSELAGASGVFTFIRLTVGGGFGTSIYITMWSRRSVFHHSRLGESITDFNPLQTQFYDHLHHTLQMPKGTAYQFINNLVSGQSSLLAVNEIFWLTGWVFITLIPLAWFCRPLQQKGETAIMVE